MHFGPEDDAGVSSLYPAPSAAPGVAVDLAGLIRTLKSQIQVDEDGTLCGVSRQAVDEAITNLATYAALLAGAAGGEPVYLVHSGLLHEGESLYTRHDVCPPLCDAEKLYTAHPVPVRAPQDVSLDEVRAALAIFNNDNNETGTKAMRRALEAFAASRVVTGALPASNRDALIDLIQQHLICMYHCTRVWEAWNVGTMTQDDFIYAPESDTAAELADAILAATPPSAAPAEPDMRAICETLGFDPTNHHNAAKCPYCRPASGEVQVDAARPNNAVLVPSDQLAELQKEAELFRSLVTIYGQSAIDAAIAANKASVSGGA